MHAPGELASPEQKFNSFEQTHETGSPLISRLAARQRRAARRLTRGVKKEVGLRCKL